VCFFAINGAHHRLKDDIRMASIRNCDVREDLYYLVNQHVWALPVGEGRVRVGLTPAGYAVLRHSLVAVALREHNIGKLVPKGKSIALVESLKYIGPVPAPFSGILLCGNERVEADPDLAMNDPYGDGWIAEMQPEDWSVAAAAMLTGEAAVAAYRALLESLNISCD
jgi:glycine cleavage system H protein